jgi:argininosuccinate lyase
MRKERVIFNLWFVCFIAWVTLLVVSGTAGAQSTPKLDAFYTIGEMNKASIVMLCEKGIVPKPIGGKIARGITQQLSEGDQAGAKRPTDYLVIEARLTELVGEDASRVHTGRSRQDMGSTTERIFLREALLEAFETMNKARGSLLLLASKNVDTIIPAYTHGVQAQPTTFAHYLLALAESLNRDGDRLRQAYARINLSPLGAAALGTSSFPIDRGRLAVFLGFDGIADNSYGANHVSPAETNIEFACDLAISAITIGHFAQDIHTQYHDPVPWFMLREGELTGISSIMPQKRNPWALNTLRQACSRVIGNAESTFVMAHNVTSGMFDVRSSAQAVEAARNAAGMYKLLGDIMDNLVVNRERALAEVNADYSTMTEVADVLVREGNVPFRIGHHFASELTNYGRSTGKRPTEIPYAEAVRIYKDVAGDKLPLTEAQFKASMSAESMVFGALGRGGPQREEVNRMLLDQRRDLTAQMEWVMTQRTKLQNASTELQKEFKALAETESK